MVKPGRTTGVRLPPMRNHSRPLGTEHTRCEYYKQWGERGTVGRREGKWVCDRVSNGCVSHDV